MKKFFTMKNLKKFLIVTLGSALVSLGVYLFIMDYNIPMGGVSGFAIALQYVFPKLQVGYVMTGLNVILFILSFIFLGKEYVGYTIYSAMFISNGITFLENFIPLSEPLTSNVLLSIIIGVVISGGGMAIVISQNCTTGGTDILASIINKFTHMDISKALLICDGLVVLFGFVAIGIEQGLYGALGVALNSMSIDYFITGFNTRISMYIISTKSEEINNHIIKNVTRGTTIYYAKGGYSQQPKEIIHTVVTRRQYFQIKNQVIKIDPKAFVTMNMVNEVVGEGFTYKAETK